MFLIAGNPLHSLTHTQTISPQALSRGARARFCLCRAGWFRSIHMPAARQLLSTMFANRSISCAPRRAGIQGPKACRPLCWCFQGLARWHMFCIVQSQRILMHVLGHTQYALSWNEQLFWVKYRCMFK